MKPIPNRNGMMKNIALMPCMSGADPLDRFG
jgi:hypothetical protein